jgi:hypothetical protein
MSRPLNCQLASTMMVLSFCVMTIVRGTAAQNVVCSGGFGSFKAVFATGVAVSVGAKPNSEFAARTCRAKVALGAEAVMNLVIDAAGKVRSASQEGKPGRDLISATANWKFIPAFKAGRPVASRLQLGVTPSQ